MRRIPLDRARELFEYDEKEGLLKRITRSNGGNSIGDAVGAKDSRGHLQVKIDGVLFGVHRVCFAMYYNIDEFGEVDHIDRCRTNNRISNLREVTRSQNVHNTASRKNNSLGLKNIVLEGRKFRVDINGKYYGSFYSLHDAIRKANEIRVKEHGRYAYIEDISNIKEIDNSIEFNIAGYTEDKMIDIAKLNVKDAIEKHGVSRSSYYRIKKHLVRYVDNGTAIPQEVMDKRAEARLIV